MLEGEIGLLVRARKVLSVFISVYLLLSSWVPLLAPDLVYAETLIESGSLPTVESGSYQTPAPPSGFQAPEPIAAPWESILTSLRETTNVVYSVSTVTYVENNTSVELGANPFLQEVASGVYSISPIYSGLDPFNLISVKTISLASTVYGDPYEPNDLPEQATLLPMDTYLNGVTFSSAGDVEWFKISVPEDAGLRIDFIGLPQGLGLTASLYSSLATGPIESISFGDDRLMSTKVKTGNYFLKVFNYKSYTVGGGISIRATLIRDDKYEPNDDPEETKAINLGETVDFSLNAFNDVDWFKVSVNGGGLTVNFPYLPDNQQFYVAIYSAEDLLNPMITQWVDRWRSTAGVAVGDGDYFIRISNVSQNFSPIKMNVGIVPADPFENNNTFFSATPLTIGGSIYFNLNTPSDIDWFVIDISKPMVLNVNLSGENNYKSDFRMAVFTEENLVVPIYQNWGFTRTFSIPVSPGRYYLKGDNDNFSQFITLKISQDLSDPNEMNNTPDQATLITLNNKVNYKLIERDIDWFKIDIPQSGCLNLNFSNNYSSIGYSIFQEDDLSNPIYESDALKNKIIKVKTGKYFIRLKSEYSWSESIFSFIPILFPDDMFEFNDTPSTATRVYLGELLEISLNSSEDADWFKVHVDQSGGLGVDLIKLPGNLRAGFNIYRNDNPDQPIFSLPYTKESSVYASKSVSPGDYLVEIFTRDGTSSPTAFYAVFNLIPPDANEPNDQPEQATVVRTGYDVNGGLHAGDDVDWFKFTVPVISRLKAVFSGLVGWVRIVAANFPVSHSLYGQFSQFIYNQGEVDIPLRPGDYYLSVSNGNNYSPGMKTGADYKFNLQSIPLLPDPYEDNDTPGNAWQVNLDRVLDGISLPFVDDEDWFRVEVREGGSLAINYYNLPYQELGLRTVLYRADENSYPIKQIYETGNSSFSTRVNPGIYLLQLKGTVKERYDYYWKKWYPVNQGYSITPFAMRVKLQQPDVYEKNDIPENATPLIIDQALAEATIDVPDDVDWYKVHITENGGLQFKFYHFPFWAMDAEIYRTGDFNQPLFSSWSWQTNPSFTVPAEPGDYFLKIKSRNGYYSSNGYGLKVNFFNTDKNEPNNSYHQAIPVPIGQKIDFTLHEPNDQDWYQVIVDRTGGLQLSFDNLPDNTYFYLKLYHDANLFEPIFTKEVFGNIRTSKKIAPGKYFIRVSSAWGNAFGAPATLGFNFVPSEPDDDNDNYHLAIPIQTGVSIQNHLINAADDQDWFKFSLADARLARIALTDIPGSLVEVFKITDILEPIVSQTMYDSGSVDVNLELGEYYLKVGGPASSFSDQKYAFYIDTQAAIPGSKLVLTSDNNQIQAGSAARLKVQLQDSFNRIVMSANLIKLGSSSATTRFSLDGGLTWTASNYTELILNQGLGELWVKDEKSTSGVQITVQDGLQIGFLQPGSVKLKVMPAEAENISILEPPGEIKANMPLQLKAVITDCYGNLVNVLPYWEVVSGTGGGVINNLTGLFAGTRSGTVAVRAGVVTSSGPRYAEAPLLVLPPSRTFIKLKQPARVPLNSVFAVDLEVYDVKELYGVEFSLLYNPDLLEVVYADGSPANRIDPGNISMGFIAQNKVYPEQGRVDFATICLGQGSGYSGQGTLAHIYFRAKSRGVILLYFDNIQMSDNLSQSIFIPMPRNDSITVISGGGLNGLARLEAVKDYSGVKIQVNDRVVISETQGNFILDDLSDGDYSLLFTREGYLKKRLKQVHVTDGGVVNLDPVTLVAGDITGDNKISLDDLLVLANSFRTEAGETFWNQKADIDHSQTVDIFDLTYLARNYGQVGDY